MVTRREPKEDMSFEWRGWAWRLLCVWKSSTTTGQAKLWTSEVSGFKRRGVEGAGLESVRKQMCERVVGREGAKLPSVWNGWRAPKQICGQKLPSSESHYDKEVLFCVTPPSDLVKMSSCWRPETTRTIGCERWCWWTPAKDTCTVRKKGTCARWRHTLMGMRTAASNQERECSGTLEDAICTVGRATSCAFHHSSLRTETTLLLSWRTRDVWNGSLKTLKWKIARGLLFLE